MYGSTDEPGIAPRTLDHLFETLDGMSGYTYTMRCYMLELYQDTLIDVFAAPQALSPRGSLTGLPGKETIKINKDSKGIVVVDGVTERWVSTKEELARAMEEGIKQRHITETKMNVESSRSHLLFTILVEVTNIETQRTNSGKLTLVDLAGSERTKKSGVQGGAMEEAKAINKSLSALGDVISSLTQKEKHIPYRNHKLTQLLSDSLGGAAKTLMFVNVSPAASNAEETASSLQYAARAKQIKNKVSRNDESQELIALRQENIRLQRMVGER